jgi:hypothetical protein
LTHGDGKFVDDAKTGSDDENEIIEKDDDEVS